MSGMCSVCACSIPRGSHLRAACSQAKDVLVHVCEQSLPGVAQVLAVLSGAEGGDLRALAPTAVQKQIDQMLPLDLTPSGSFEQELIFGWVKKEVVSHLLCEKLTEGKGGGKRGRGRERHCYNHTEVCLSTCIYIYIHNFKYFGLYLLKYTISLVYRKIAKKTSTDR